MAEITSDRESLERLRLATEGEGDENTLALSTGVVLRLKKVSPMLVTDTVIAAMKQRPKPPVEFIPEVDREEDNPNSPDYINAVKEWQAGVLLDINNAFVLLGTEVLSVPDGFPSMDSEEFEEEMKILGMVVGGPRLRYLTWVKYRAAASDVDVALITAKVGRLSGVSQADVREAVDGFQREVRRGPPDGGEAPSHDSDES